MSIGPKLIRYLVGTIRFTSRRANLISKNLEAMHMNLTANQTASTRHHTDFYPIFIGRPLFCEFKDSQFINKWYSIYVPNKITEHWQQSTLSMRRPLQVSNGDRPFPSRGHCPSGRTWLCNSQTPGRTLHPPIGLQGVGRVSNNKEHWQRTYMASPGNNWEMYNRIHNKGGEKYPTLR